MFCGAGKWMGKAKRHGLTLQDNFAKYMYWICFDLSCNQELVSTQGFHVAKRCGRVFSSKVKQIMESQGQGHPLLWEGTKFQNENVYYMYCLDYIQSVKSILLHKPYLIFTPPTFVGRTLLDLLDKTKHSPLTDNAPNRRTGSETRVRYLPIVSIRESHACGGRMCFTASPPITKHSSSLKHRLLLCYHLNH